MSDDYTLPECASKPGYEGTFCIHWRKEAISKNWITKLEVCLK